MKDFNPIEVMLAFGKNKPQRMIYKPKDGVFTEEEKTALKAFKEFCKQKGEPTPGEDDSEILRILVKKVFNIQKSYQFIIDREKLLNDLLPLPIDPIVAELISTGFIYIGGRDRHYRPFLVIRPAIMFA